MTYFFTTLLITLFTLSGFSQNKSHLLPNKVDIPFEYINDLIVIQVTFQQTFPLRFIFDTGAEHSILSRKEITDLLGFQYIREFDLVGSDMSTKVKAHLINGAHLEMGEGLVAPFHSLLVLEEDYFKFEEVMGMQIHGIIGADIFRNFVLKINYSKRVITLYKPKYFKEPKNPYKKIAIEINKNKPYINCPIHLQNDTILNTKLLVDSGASVSLILNTDTHEKLELPETVLTGDIGKGLGGFLEGFLGRINAIGIGPFELTNVLTNFQELPPNLDTSLLNGRHGLLGNQILKRFTIVIDYWNEQLYLLSNKRLNCPFEYDKSGLVIIAAGVNLNNYIVHNVIKNSPAEEAGILEGDELKVINRFPAALLSLHSLNKIFSKKEGKKITLVIKRNGKRMKVHFTLQQLI